MIPKANSFVNSAQLTVVVGVKRTPLPIDVIKSELEICEFWLSFEKSELLDIPSLNSSFISWCQSGRLLSRSVSIAKVKNITLIAI